MASTLRAGQRKLRNDDARGKGAISAREGRDIEEMSSPRTPVIYKVVSKFGQEEMDRPAVSLWWSGLAAGLSISFSLLAQTILELRLPETSWSPLLAATGYAVGFVIVIISRQQLFTENTVTAVLPLLADFTPRNLWRLSRLWAIVLLANMAGALAAALFFSFTPALDGEMQQAMLKISGQILNHGWLAMMVKAVAAGFLMAAMVWLLPGSESAQVPVIVMMTWLISAGGFMHIVAGSVEAFMLVLHGDMGWFAMLLDFTAPVLIGNIVGGTVLFAVLAHAQVMQEI
jgi:formate/nitrite transporter FocA (FNT family)